ncbi:unknown protein [Simkania negevensis Z]|uniref:Uncharacterized protein n=1 Tax=Simkania negevensis (strain ATCC VR-1471 / DSM 27360 / Z) TaxID=331113 RepID=F8L6N7_SIMNZ|nr:unknown protein [Simkania negevensis Z]
MYSLDNNSLFSSLKETILIGDDWTPLTSRDALFFSKTFLSVLVIIFFILLHIYLQLLIIFLNYFNEKFS